MININDWMHRSRASWVSLGLEPDRTGAASHRNTYTDVERSCDDPGTTATPSSLCDTSGIAAPVGVRRCWLCAVTQSRLSRKLRRAGCGFPLRLLAVTCLRLSGKSSESCRAASCHCLHDSDGRTASSLHRPPTVTRMPPL
jgi:hypothetical protein